ncbi:MAG: ABC transporter substrate-binding protein [Micrococcales bacterium]|nr:ABC transporter substrate-binding protein [Micrococcales bacterium]
MRRIGSAAATVLVAALLVTLVGCGDRGRSRDDAAVVVSTDYRFGSLNAATAAGRTPGSTLVRGLVQSGFTTTDATGAVVADASFGTVEKLSDSPLTVRYTIADGVTWSDGVPVTPADLLLEWAARSGQLDEIVPLVGGDGTAPVPPDVDQSVAFWAASPALVHVQAVPTVEGRSLTLVYSTPVADWLTALDVNVPAHVVGRLALQPTAARPSPTGTPEPAPTTAGWADAVAAAIGAVDRDALVAISRQWRAYGERAALVADPTLAVTCGPYRIAQITDERTVLVPDQHYTGERPGTIPTVEIRADLDPLAQVRAVRSGGVDVALPVSSPDVHTAAGDGALTVRTGPGAVLQLWLGEQPTSPFAGDAGAARRSAFVAALDRTALVRLSGAAAADVVLPQVGPDWTASETALEDPADPAEDLTDQVGDPADPTDGPADQAEDPADAPAGDPADQPVPTVPAARVPVRLLVDSDDPVRAALAAAIVDQAGAAGFDVTRVTTDLTVALWSQPGRWDAALVPVVQDPLPVSGVVARWRTGGAANVTAHSDARLDALLDAVVAQTDPAAATAALTGIDDVLDTAHVVVPLVRQPVMSVVRRSDTRLAAVRPPDWAVADLSGWWAWLP